MRQELVNQISSMFPLMKQLNNDDVSLSLWDTTGKLLFFQEPKDFPKKLNPNHVVTDQNDPIFVAMKENRVVHTFAPKEISGRAIEGNIVPITDQGEIVGCVVCAFPVDEKEELKQRAKNMHDALIASKDIFDKTYSFATQSKEYLSSTQTFITSLQKSVTHVMESVTAIKKNANSTKILALNASIEAARAREAGLGFNIVAKEMSRLSEFSTTSVTQIEEALRGMTQSMNNVLKSLEHLNEISSIEDMSIDSILADLQEDNKK